VVCYSRNFWTPADEVQEKQNSLCHKKTARKPIPACPHASWTGSGDARLAPKCEEAWVLAIAIVDGQSRVFVREDCALLYLRKTNLPYIRDFMGAYRTIYKRLPLFGAAMDLTLGYRQKKDGYQGNFYTVTWPDLKKADGGFYPVPVEQLGELADAARFFSTYFEEGDVVIDDASVSAPAPKDEDEVIYDDEEFQPTPTKKSSSAGATTTVSTSPSGHGWGSKK
jgi:hypothetical protein